MGLLKTSLNKIKFKYFLNCKTTDIYLKNVKKLEKKKDLESIIFLNYYLFLGHKKLIALNVGWERCARCDIISYQKDVIEPAIEMAIKEIFNNIENHLLEK